MGNSKNYSTEDKRLSFSIADDETLDSLLNVEWKDTPFVEDCQYPPCNIKITADHIYITILVPGVDKKDVQLIINPYSVIVAATASNWNFSFEKDENFANTTIYNELDLVSPYWKYDFERRVDTQRAEARLEFGLLFLDIPILEEDAARIVPVA